ncbi:DUF421 domain-containing protein [Mesobacillus foraminis]|uniref:DUF421 domain-containing protein n=1 Tax=Mesobacillus foraminis TaxID=279826 RepID=UPI00214B625C|nr:DUF421 domain-containing protein [Mesobacillus foraminis]
MFYAGMALKLLIGLAALVIVTRILGKKHMSQVTPFDFVYALILGGMVEETIYHADHTVPQMIFSITVWGILIYTVEKLTQKVDWLRGPLKGSTQVLIKDGKISIKELERANLELEQLRSLLRQKDVFSLREVKYVFLETNGEISVLKYQKSSAVKEDGEEQEVEEIEPAILVVDEGKIHEHNLKAVDKDREWLMDGLKKEGITDIEDIYYAEWSASHGFFIKTYDHCISV